MTATLRDLPLDGRGPAYDQIYRALRAAILEGRARGGTRLPATRSLAAELGLSRTTVLSAYEQLLAEGYAEGRVGSGTYVALRPPSPPRRMERARGSTDTTSRPGSPAGASHRPTKPRLSRYGTRLMDQAAWRTYEADLALPPARFDFRPCLPELERLPLESWRRTLARCAAHASPRSFDYADPRGAAPLRRALADYLGRARGVRCDAGQIVIVGGVAQALDLATRLFVDPGDPVLLEEPHYLGARRAFEAAGARLRTAAVDGEGLDLGRAPAEALAGCRLVYTTPSHQFPSAAVMSLSRRLELLRWAEATGAWVIEDDYDSEFRYSGRAIEALKCLDESGRVIYVGTFSKTLLPALRVAYLVLPETLVEPFRMAKWLSDWASPTFEQLALARFIEGGDFERHLRRARTLYGRSRDALLEALKQSFGDSAIVRDSGAGLHLPVRLSGLAGSDEPALLSRARELGVAVYPARPCYLRPPDDLELVMGFTRLDEGAIGEGVSRFARVVEELRAGS